MNIVIYDYKVQAQYTVSAIWESQYYIRYATMQGQPKTFNSSEATRIAARLNAQFKTRGERCRAETR